MEKPSSTNTLTWLHISDLQFGNPTERASTASTLLRDVVALMEDPDLRPSLILVAGDIAYSGKPAEYREAAPFFDNLQQVTGVPPERIVFVPGDHDADREAMPTERPLSLLSADPASDELYSAQTSATFSAGLESYLSFARRYAHLESTGSGLFGTTNTEQLGTRITVLRLDSARRSIPPAYVDADRGFAFLGKDQKAALLAFEPEADLHIGLLHHPPESLGDWDQRETIPLLYDQCDLVLHGHTHGWATARIETRPSGHRTLIVGTPMRHPRPKPSGYSIGRLDLTTRSGEIHLRIYNENEGRWAADTLSLPDAPDGVYHFDLSSPSLTPKSSVAQQSAVQNGGGAVPGAEEGTGTPPEPSPAQPPTPADTLPRPGYSADTTRGPDRLDIVAEVRAIASLLVDEDTEPPLCLGLFGDWGSGKTFFMGKLEERIRLVAKQAHDAQERGDDTYFCSHVAHIPFNAWHYMDSNLWAALVNHIFEGLAGELDQHAQPEQRARMYQELNTAKELLNQAQKDKAAAQADLERARIELEELQREREREALSLRNIRRELFQKFLASNKLRDAVESAAKQLGLPRAAETADDLNSTLDELRTVRGRLQASLAGLLRAPDWKGQLLLIAGILVLVPAAGIAVKWALDQLLAWRGFAERFSLVQTDLLALLGGLTTWLKLWLDRSSKAIQTLEQAQKQVDEMKAKGAQPDQQELLARQKLSGLREREAALQAAVSGAEERVQQAQSAIQQLEALDDGRRLAQFIQERLACEDYRRQLGIISTIRRDLQTLSDQMAKQAAHRRKQKEERRRGAPAAHDAQATAQDQAEFPRLDRIVLYIDDLDRCPEQRVVEVLQAVHLLLAFPLFVVLMGVDSRWVLHSLQQRFPSLQAARGEHAWMSEEEAYHWTTTPQDYLEKIFQIPFHLPPMSADGFRNLVHSILPETESTVAISTSPTPIGAAEGQVPSSPAVQSEAQSPAARVPTEAQAATPAAKTVGPALPATEAPADATAPEESVFQTPKNLRITPKEKDVMPLLAPLVPTPRAAKRLVNVYRLLRAMLPDGQLAEFIGDASNPTQGDFRAAMVLLAILTGFPRQACEILRRFMSPGVPPTWKAVLQACRPSRKRSSTPPEFKNQFVHSMSGAEAEEWRQLVAALEAVERSFGPDGLGSGESYARWAERVARFSFRAGRLAD